MLFKSGKTPTAIQQVSKIREQLRTGKRAHVDRCPQPAHNARVN